MSDKTVQIHFRVTEKERTAYQRSARKCGLSLSEYLRKLANGHEPKALPPMDYRELMGMISDLRMDFLATGERQYVELLFRILRDMQAAIAPDGA